ncbi:tetratricopeptide repeat protein [Mongoliitalea daihaiensis]|nr:tetratricopeptide repeat protein [Mongoliitalea daihaiensis]
MNQLSKVFYCLWLSILINVGANAQQYFEIDAEERDNSIVISNTAIDMMNKGNYESAFRLLEKVIDSDPSFLFAYLNLYKAGSQLPAKTDQTVAVLRKGLTIFEENDELAYYLGNILQKNGRLQEAINAYSEAIAYSKINGEDYPLVWAYHFNRGNCYLKANQHAKAIPNYDYALKLNPKNADVLTNRGFCHYKTNQRSNACADWVLASSLGRKEADKYLESFCK